MTWLILRSLLLKHWRGCLLALLVGFIAVSLWIHIHHDNQTEMALIQAQSELEQLQAQLADADRAAKVAIAAKVEAEQAAAKKLREREKYWKDKYAHDPEAKAWSEQPVPAGVLDGLR